MIKNISSFNNPIIKNLLKLTKARYRKEQNLIIIDGYREIQLALQNNYQLVQLFYCPDLDNKNKIKELPELAPDKIIKLSKAVFNKVCYKQKADGLLATVHPRYYSLTDIKLNSNLIILVLENVEKPGNLGAIIRTAVAGGVSAIIINDHQTDIYNPNTIRASEGYIFKQTLISASVTETIAWLKENKIKSFGASTSQAKNYTQVDLRGKIALVLGSEAQGLSLQWLKSADQLIKIPMLSQMDSLNVSVAAAIILFEALRQKNIEK